MGYCILFINNQQNPMGQSRCPDPFFLMTLGRESGQQDYQWGITLIYRIVKNYGGKKLWQNGTFETLTKKTLANPRLVCIFIIVCARQL